MLEKIKVEKKIETKGLKNEKNNSSDCFRLVNVWRSRLAEMSAQKFSTHRLSVWGYSLEEQKTYTEALQSRKIPIEDVLPCRCFYRNNLRPEFFEDDFLEEIGKEKKCPICWIADLTKKETQNRLIEKQENFLKEKMRRSIRDKERRRRKRIEKLIASEEEQTKKWHF